MGSFGKIVAVSLTAITLGVMLVTGALWLLDTQFVSESEHEEKYEELEAQYQELEREKDYLVCAVRFDPCVCEVVILPLAKQTCQPERR